jgi:cytochrome c oxidase assembly protein subunit 11
MVTNDISRATPKPRGSRTALWLGGLAALMFGFGFALAPLYSLLCDAVGIQSASADVARTVSGTEAPQARQVTVRFDTNVPAELPWEFSVDQPRLALHPGQMQEMTFHVRNRSNQAIVGRAIATVLPWQASAHFTKTECFCFQDQALAPGESKELVVRFMVSPKLPDDIDALTLSYTFLRHAADPEPGPAPAPSNSKG